MVRPLSLTSFFPGAILIYWALSFLLLSLIFPTVNWGWFMAIILQKGTSGKITFHNNGWTLLELLHCLCCCCLRKKLLLALPSLKQLDGEDITREDMLEAGCPVCVFLCFVLDEFVQDLQHLLTLISASQWKSDASDRTFWFNFHAGSVDFLDFFHCFSLFILVQSIRTMNHFQYL